LSGWGERLGGTLGRRKQLTKNETAAEKEESEIKNQEMYQGLERSEPQALPKTDGKKAGDKEKCGEGPRLPGGGALRLFKGD